MTEIQLNIKEGLEDLPESGLLVTSELQVVKNLNILENHLHSDEFHDFAVKRIRIGSTFRVSIPNNLNMRELRFKR